MQYIPEFLCATEARELLDWLLKKGPIEWRREQFKIFGKMVLVPRRLAWCGDAGVNYRYTGLDHAARGWHAPLADLRDKIAREHGLEFNFVLLNRYDRGADHMGWHRDDESGLQTTIASVSLGNPRKFRYRDGPGQPSTAIELAHGSLALLDGHTQHMLAKTSRPVGVRVNLTFRQVD